ncbi:MAG: hypothetical protein HYY00_00125 [Chloroflexi bacterium]|nr:hypothetical protein [Chloroflexota bacterium]
MNSGVAVDVGDGTGTCAGVTVGVGETVGVGRAHAASVRAAARAVAHGKAAKQAERRRNEPELAILISSGPP